MCVCFQTGFNEVKLFHRQISEEYCVCFQTGFNEVNLFHRQISEEYSEVVAAVSAPAAPAAAKEECLKPREKLPDDKRSWCVSSHIVDN